MLGQLGCVGCEGKLFQSMPEFTSQRMDQIHNITPDQWLTASQPDFRDPAGDKAERQPVQLFQAQHFLARQELHSFGHAIGAAQIAPIRHRKAQIADPPLKRINQRRSGGNHISDPIHGLDNTVRWRLMHPLNIPPVQLWLADSRHPPH